MNMKTQKYIFKITNDNLNIYFQTKQSIKGAIDINQKTLLDFFMTDSITRASPTMAKCVAAVKKQMSANA